MQSKRTHHILSVFALAFLVRCFAYVLMGRLAHPKFWEYHEIAENFLLGKGLMYSFLNNIPVYAFAEPFYSILSASIYFLTNHNYAIFGIVNMLASSGITIAVYYLGKQLADERVGLLAALLTALHPGLIYFATQFHPLTFNALFVTLIILALGRLYQTPKVKNAIASGILIGLAFLDRSLCLIFIPIAAGLLVFSNTSARIKLKLCIIVILISLVPVTAWSIRNYILFHKVVVGRSSAGYLFWIGNNPRTTSSAMYDKNTPMIYTLDKETLKKFNTMNELEIDAYLMNKGMSFVKSRPYVFLWNWAKRFYYFWWFPPFIGMQYPPAWLVAYKIFYMGVFFTAIYALISITTRREKIKDINLPDVYLVVLCVLALAAAQSLFYVEGRHRWAIEPILMIFSSWTIVQILTLKKRIV